MDAASTTTKLKSIFRATLDNILKKNIFFITAFAVGGVSIIISLLLWAGKPDYRLLYSNMSDKDAGAITAQLTQQQIPYRFDENEGAILVPADAVYETRLKLAQLGLPKGGTVGFELMDKEKFGISQFNEQVNYQRALEGELARTIENLAPINRVRVHLALPKPSLFVREAKPPSASITLTLFPDSILEASQVTAIANLVSSAVPGLSVDRVTLVDQNGRLLSSKNELVTQSEQLKLINDIENDYLRRILAILVPIVGIDNVQAQVTAELDFTEQEQTDELYQPNDSDRPKAIRSQQRSLANQGGGIRVGGVPGALSNQAPLPPQALLESVGTTANVNDKVSPPGGMPDPKPPSPDKPYSQRSDETTNFELDKTLIHTRKNRGSITRLSAAVIINYLSDIKGEKIPLDKQRLDEIKALVQEAMGYSKARGDTLNIANVPFNAVSNEQDIALWQQPQVIQSAIQLCRYLLVFILLWLLWRKVVQPFWVKQHELALARCAANTRQADRAEESTEESAEAAQRNQQNEQERRLRGELAVDKLRTLAEQDPQLIALVMRQWISKEAKTS